MAGRMAVLVLVSLLTRAILLPVPVIDLDEAAHAVGSWELLRGGVLYQDFADNKPPLVYVYFALCQLLFGRGLLAVRLVTTLLVLPVTAWLASAALGHGRRGLAAGLLYLVFGAAFLGHDMLAVNCEVLMLLPAAGAAALVFRAERAHGPLRVAAAGALLGVAVLFKHQSGFWLPAIALAAARASRTWRARALSLAAAAAGFALPLLVTYAAFTRLSGAEGLVEWTLSQNLVYAANPIRPEEAAERAASYLLPFLLATAPLWIAWRLSNPLRPSSHERALVAALVLLSIPPAFLGFRFFPHYFVQMLWPLAVAAAPWAAAHVWPARTRLARWAVAHTAVVSVGFAAANAVLYYATRVYEETRPIYRQVAERLRADPCFPEATLFVWGYAPIFYYEARLPAASRFVMPQSTLTGYVAGNRGSASGLVDTRRLVRADHWSLLLRDLERRRATYVLDTSPAGLHRWRYPMADFPIGAYLRERYRPIADVAGVHVWRRTDCAARAR
jgi:4-amino-4-deoxy-L-arabinose transferase-like glycosyltransferase